MNSEASLEALLLACPQDSTALERIFLTEKRCVFAFAYSILSDYALAEDAVQETFLRLPRAARKFHSAHGGRNFLLEITKRVSMELLRKHRNFSRQETLPEELAGREVPLEDIFTVQSLLSGLDRNKREVIVLHLYHEMSFPMIARLLSVPESTVKSRWQKALVLLRERLGGSYETL